MAEDDKTKKIEGEGRIEDQAAINKDARAALDQANVRFTLDLFFTADGIRPVEIPETIDEKIITLLAKRIPPSITAAMLGYPGLWRLNLRAVSGSSFTKTEA